MEMYLFLYMPAITKEPEIDITHMHLSRTRPKLRPTLHKLKPQLRILAEILIHLIIKMQQLIHIITLAPSQPFRLPIDLLTGIYELPLYLPSPSIRSVYFTLMHNYILFPYIPISVLIPYLQFRVTKLRHRHKVSTLYLLNKWQYFSLYIIRRFLPSLSSFVIF